MKEFLSSSAPKAIEQGESLVAFPMWEWDGEIDGARQIGIITSPEAWLHIADALHRAGKAGLPNSPIYAVLADAVAFRFGMELR